MNSMKPPHIWGKQNYRKRIQEWASSADDVIQNTWQRTEDGIHTGHAREAMEETWGRSEGPGENRKSWERTPGFKHIQLSCPRVNNSQQCLNPEWYTENNASNQKQSVK